MGMRDWIIGTLGVGLAVAVTLGAVVTIDAGRGGKEKNMKPDARRPTQVLIFGNPQAGTPLMQSRQTIGLDLPLRVLIWEDEAGKVWLTYRRPSFLAERHQVSGQDDAVKALDDGLAALARAATAQ